MMFANHDLILSNDILFLITGRDADEFQTLDTTVVQFVNNSMCPCFDVLLHMDTR